MSPTSYQLLYPAIYFRTLEPKMVPVTGLEPVQYCYREILSLLCLPFHHTGGYRHDLIYHRLSHVSRKNEKFFKKVGGKNFLAPQKKRHFAGESVYTVQVRKGGIPMWPQKNNETDVDDMIFQEEWHISER